MFWENQTFNNLVFQVKHFINNRMPAAMAIEPRFNTAAKLGCKPLMKTSFPEGHTKSQRKAATEHGCQLIISHTYLIPATDDNENKNKVLVCQATDHKTTSIATFPTGNSKRVSTSFWQATSLTELPLQLRMLQISTRQDPHNMLDEDRGLVCDIKLD